MSTVDLQELLAMPHGQAARVIRRTIDPLWGIIEGETIQWEARALVYNCCCSAHSECCRYGASYKEIFVDAAGIEAARKFAFAVFQHQHKRGVYEDDIDVRPHGEGPWL